jgi:Raf kinase inhibitor-like YbhB/YbcL family protein
MSFQIESDAFGDGDPIPRRFSCDGDDVSPPLSWTAPPAESASLALIVDDPDAPAGTWVHWVLWGIPADSGGLPEAIPASARLEDGTTSGKNSWGRLGYGGPCPPRGTHRYFFKLYALDASPDIEPGATKERLLAAMKGHILAEARLMGTYTR